MSQRQAPTGSSNHSETNEDLSADDHSSVPGTATYVVGDDGSFTRTPRERRRRRKFDKKRREEVAWVRKIGACDDCRSRKVRCPHALQITDTEPSPILKPLSQIYPSDFESTHAGTWGGDTGQWPRQDEAQPGDPSANDGTDLLQRIPVPLERSDKRALDLHKFDDVFENNADRALSNTSPWAYDQPWAPPIVTNDQQYSPSSTVYLSPNTIHSIDADSPSITQQSSNVDFLLPNIANEYLPSLGNNSITIQSQRPSGDDRPITIEDYRKGRSIRGGNPRKSHSQSGRIHREPRLRNSSSMRKKLSSMVIDDPLQKFQDQFNVSVPPHDRLNSTEADFNVFSRAPRTSDQQVAMELANDPNGQYGTFRCEPRYEKSGTPSRISQFQPSSQIADKYLASKPSSEIGEAFIHRGDRPRMLATSHTLPPHTTPTSERNWNPQNQISKNLNQHAFQYITNMDRSCSFHPIPTWSGQSLPASISQGASFVNDPKPFGHPSEAQDQQYTTFMDSGPSPNFHIAPPLAEQPVIALNGQIMSNVGPQAEYSFPPEDVSSDPISQQNSYPSLGFSNFSNLSSSGANESLVSPADAPHLVDDKYGDENWDVNTVDSSFLRDFDMSVGMGMGMGMNIINEYEREMI